MDIDKLQTPFYLLDEKKLEDNLKLLDYVQKQSGAKILLALKGFAFWSSFDLVSKYLYGCCASGLYEAKLANEEMQREVHTYSPAFKDEDIDEILSISDHIVFNSFNQWQRYKQKAINSASCGIRVNPQTSFSPKEIYNPCATFSRLGVTKKEFRDDLLEGICGLHFHALCEQNVDALQEVLKSFEEKFSHLFEKMQWINFGGGHHITREDYDVERLIWLIRDFKARFDVEVYLELGEAVGWQCGFLVSSVLDIVHNEMDIVILDTSAEAHMSDIIIMPYRADVQDASLAGERAFTYRLASNTCLAGDIMGDYSFDKPLKIGDRVVFEDQMHYTIVKNTTFNGIKLPNLVVKRKDGSVEVVRKFGYEEYKRRN